MFVLVVKGIHENVALGPFETVDETRDLGWQRYVAGLDEKIGEVVEIKSAS